MINNRLKEIEIWQQNYNFDYNCFDSDVRNLENIRKHLIQMGIGANLLTISKIFNSGNLYGKTEDERISIIRGVLNNEFVNLPSSMTNLHFTNSILAGEYSQYLSRMSFRLEFEKYMNSLTSHLRTYSEFEDLPKIENLDLDLFMIGYTSLCGSYVNEDKDFSDYLGMIGNQEIGYKMLSSIGRNHLNNPLFYKFIVSTLDISLSPELRTGAVIKNSRSNEKWLDIVLERIIWPNSYNFKRQKVS